MSQGLSLLASRRFLPLWVVQETSAFGDNLFKSAFIMLVTYRLPAGGVGAGTMSALAGASLVAPYFLFSSLAGEIADKYDRALVIRTLKWTELAIAVLASATLLSGSAWPALITLFGLGAQATFISPVKYAILPQHLATDELVIGNALFEGGTFLSVLIGTIAGGVTATGSRGEIIASALLILSSSIGVLASRFVPDADPPAPQLKLNRNPFTGNLAVVREAARQPEVNRAILAISWFWLVGATLLTQFPNWAKTVLGAGSGVVTLFLAAFSIGIGVGAALGSFLVHGKPTSRLAPLSALAMGLCCLDLWAASPSSPMSVSALIGVRTFLSTARGWEIFSGLTGLAIAGGVFAVPLYALVQRDSNEQTRARIIAANNIWNAIYMTGATVATGIMLQLGGSVLMVFIILGFGCFGVSAITHWRLRLPELAAARAET